MEQGQLNWIANFIWGIADVVTGKLDVREAAARLPDEAEEPEPVDEIEAEGDPDEVAADDFDAVPGESES